jgi:hypothetical protein
MRVSDAFPSEYLKASDLHDKRGNPVNVVVVIDRIEMKDVGDDHKPVVYFQGKDRGLVLNKTNANNIAVMHGEDMDDWIGKEIQLFSTTTDFQGKTVPCIRVRPARPSDRAKPTLKVASRGNSVAVQAPEPTPHDDMNDEIPF